MQEAIEKNFDKLENCLNNMIKGQFTNGDMSYDSFEIKDRAIKDQQIISTWIKYSGEYRCCRIYYNIYQPYMALKFSDYSFITILGLDKLIEKKISLINTLIVCFSKNSSILGQKAFNLVTKDDMYYLYHSLSTQADSPLKSIDINIALLYDIINEEIIPVIRFNHTDKGFRFCIESYTNTDKMGNEKIPVIIEEKSEINLIKEIDQRFQYLFFKPIVDKPYDKLTESEKELIEMFYR